MIFCGCHGSAVRAGGHDCLMFELGGPSALPGEVRSSEGLGVKLRQYEADNVIQQQQRFDSTVHKLNR
jgi:hypothetical protein